MNFILATVTLTPEEYKDLPMDGILMLGQEQDKRGGGTDPSQSFSGEITQANMWDRALTAQEVAQMASCKLKLGITLESLFRVQNYLFCVRKRIV